MFFLSHCYPFPCHSPPCLPRCTPTLLVSGPAVGAAQTLIWSYSWVFLPPISRVFRTSGCIFVFVFFLRALNVFLNIFHRHRVCLVDHVDLIHSLYSWWEGFGSSSLATLSLGFNCGFISTSACGSSTGVCSWGAQKDLGLPHWVPGVVMVQLLGSQGPWQHQVLRGAGG